MAVTAQATNRRATRNVAWAGLDYVIMPAGLLVGTPVLIHALGLEGYGALVLVSTLTALTALFNFGFGDTALRYVAQKLSTGEVEGARQIAETISLLTILAGLAVGIVISLEATNIATLFNIDGVAGGVEAITLAGLIMPLRMLEAVHVSLLRAADRYDLAGATTAATKIGNIVAQLVLALLGFGLPYIVSAMVVAACVSVGLTYALINKRAFRMAPRFHLAAFNETRGYAGWAWIQGLAGFSYVNVDRLLISALLGPAALGVYSSCLQLAQNVHYGLSAASHSLFPRVSALAATARGGDEAASAAAAALRVLYVRASQIITTISIGGGATIAVFGGDFIDVWLGPRVAGAAQWLMPILGIAFSWFAAASISTYYTLNGLGMARMQAGVSVGSAAIMAVSSLILIPPFGLIGAALARVPDVFFRVAVRIYMVRRTMGGLPVALAVDFLVATPFAIGCLGVAHFTAAHLAGGDNVLRHLLGWLAMLGGAALSIPVTYFVLGALLPKGQDRRGT